MCGWRKAVDTDDTTPSMRRMLDVVVKCEDGTVVQDGWDIVGDRPTPIQIPAPNRVTMIDPHG